jgi:hypothetical protein
MLIALIARPPRKTFVTLSVWQQPKCQQCLGSAPVEPHAQTRGSFIPKAKSRFVCRGYLVSDGLVRTVPRQAWDPVAN